MQAIITSTTRGEMARTCHRCGMAIEHGEKQAHSMHLGCFHRTVSELRTKINDETRKSFRTAAQRQLEALYSY